MHVRPNVRRGTSDAIDATAICEAVIRATIIARQAMLAPLRGRFVAMKTFEQQALLSLHRARGLRVRQRRRLINGLRCMVAEFGVYIARGLAQVIGVAENFLAGEGLDLPGMVKEVIHDLCEQLMTLHARVRWYENRLKRVAKEDA